MIKKRPFIDHLILELFEVPLKLERIEDIDLKIKHFVKKCKLIVVKEEGHNFTPFGFTKIFVLSESHIIFHSWPEKNYLSIDLMSCKKLIEYKKIKKMAEEIFNTREIKLRKVRYN
ncbi:MAG: S-adenosylmethionine decarboxylase [Candidatus Woesearchaeota archaeon]